MRAGLREQLKQLKAQGEDQKRQLQQLKVIGRRGVVR